MREVALLPRQNNRVIWKISCPPETVGGCLDGLLARPNCRAYADWAGGLIWLSHPSGGDGGAQAIRSMVAETGGHAMLIEAPEDMRRKGDVFPPQDDVLMKLTSRIKTGFDPEGILNPGRMYEGYLTMQTQFTRTQLKNPDIARADDILRKCVHCGFCTATCPTYLVTGDERDSPRGRIWLIRDMLEGNTESAPATGYHLDRCLTCLSCMTTCPSGVDYMHLVDIGRQHVEELAPAAGQVRLFRRLLVAI